MHSSEANVVFCLTARRGLLGRQWFSLAGGLLAIILATSSACDSRPSTSQPEAASPTSMQNMLAEANAKQRPQARFTCAPADASHFTGYSAAVAVTGSQPFGNQTSGNQMFGRITQSHGGAAYNNWQFTFKADPRHSLCDDDRLVQSGVGSLSLNGQVVRTVRSVEVDLRQATMTLKTTGNAAPIVVTACQHSHLATRCQSADGKMAIAELTLR